MVPAEAVNVAEVLPEATVTDVGTVRAVLLSERLITTPADGAAALIEAVQVLLPPEARLVGVHCSEVIE